MNDTLQELDTLTLFLLFTNSKMEFVECEECHEQAFAGTKDGYKICLNCLENEMKKRGHEKLIPQLRSLNKLNDDCRIQAVFNLVNTL
ncbi:hypothetical protein AAEX28_07330 [Lentisphaerota bacterium WC36G]|nr:hypothetical protein LJT99_10190 [Lentisphaerae bacterium WC36]